MERTDVQKLAAAIGRVREIGRFQDGDDREPLVVYTSHGDTGLRYLIAQENEESLVLTPRELSWLVYRMFGDPDPIPEWRFRLGNLRWRIGRFRDALARLR
jgi:hypothetical protein